MTLLWSVRPRRPEPWKASPPVEPCKLSFVPLAVEGIPDDAQVDLYSLPREIGRFGVSQSGLDDVKLAVKLADLRW